MILSIKNIFRIIGQFTKIWHIWEDTERFFGRDQKVLKEETPIFNKYNADNDTQFKNRTQLQTEVSIDKAKIYGEDFSKQLNILTEIYLNRTCLHPKLGNKNVIEWTEFFLLHESFQFYTIFWLTKEFEIHNNNNNNNNKNES